MRLLRTAGTLEEDDCVGAKFINHLAARSARRARDTVVVGDRHGLNLDLGAELGNRGENCRSLRAVGHSVRSILHIAAGKDFAVGEQDRRADVKIRVRSMRILHHFDSRSLQFLAQIGGNHPLRHIEISAQRD